MALQRFGTPQDVAEPADAQFEQSPIREFVPLFVERRARAELAKAR